MINKDIIDALERFFTTVNLGDRVKFIILTGAGRTFSAGFDLDTDVSQGRQVPANELRDPGGTLALSMLNCSKVIALWQLIWSHAHSIGSRSASPIHDRYGIHKWSVPRP